MAIDKMRRTEPLAISFANGEQPSSAKLNAIINQSRNGSRILEKSIGDVWGQAGDQILTTHPLKIPNLARYIGKNDLLNPIFHGLPYSTSAKTIYYYDTVYKYVGHTEGFLTFPPKSGTTFSIEGTTTGFTNAVASEDLVVSTGDYWIDTTTGRFVVYRTIDATNTTTVIKYKIDPSTWKFNNNNLLPSVIPDIRQTSYNGCRVSYSSGKYYLHLPPRAPLTLSAEAPARYPAAVDWDNNSQGDYSDSLMTLWQDPTAYFVQDAHYRYSLPKEIIDVYSTIAPGGTFPDGFMYLWDDDANTVIEDIIFKKPESYTRPTSYADPTLVAATDEWVIEISSATYDLTSKVTDWHTISGPHLVEGADDYDTGLYLITTGSSVAANINQLYKLFYQHNHDNMSDMSRSISYTETYNPKITGATIYYEGEDIVYDPEYEGNDGGDLFWSKQLIVSVELAQGTYLINAQALAWDYSVSRGHTITIESDTTFYAQSTFYHITTIPYTTISISPIVVNLTTTTTIYLYGWIYNPADGGFTAYFNPSGNIGTYLTYLKIG